MSDGVVPSVAGARPHASRLRLAAGWVVVGLAVMVAVTAALLGSRSREGSQPFLVQDPWAFVAIAPALIAGAGVGALLIERVPANPIGWLLAALSLNAGIAVLGWAYATYAMSEIPPLLPAPGEVAWLTTVASLPWWPYLLTLIVVLFPDGRPAGPRWRFVIPLGLVAALAETVGLALAPGSVGLFVGLDNPHGLGGAAGALMSVLVAVGLAVGIAASAAAAFSAVDRYRRAGRGEREQLRWFAYAGTVFVAAATLFILGRGVLTARGSTLGAAAFVLVCTTALLLPVAIGIAITRYRLYEIDRIISRTFVYGALTAILAGLYAATITLLQRVFQVATGETSDAAIVLTTLVLATTFTPIKARLERVARRRLAPEPPPHLLYEPSATIATDATDGRAVRLDDQDLDLLADLLTDRMAARLAARDAAGPRDPATARPDLPAATTPPPDPG